jgi:hypothetical protein
MSYMLLIVEPVGQRGERSEAEGHRAYEQMLRFADTLKARGVLRASESLGSGARRLQKRDGRPDIVDGPFAEAKELIAGYTMIQVRDKDEALEWVRRWPAIDGHGHVQLELRRLYEADDFGAEFTPEIRKQEGLLREQADKNAKGG